MPLEKLRVPNDAWTNLVHAWGVLLDQYERLASQPPAADYDVAYWHGEQSITGTLASTAWQSGGAGIVEFETKRLRLLPEQSGGGSGDAWLLIGKSWYTVEAKLCWIPDDVRSSIEAARSQLDMLPQEDRVGAGVVLCYCVPEVRESRAGLIDGLAGELARLYPNCELVVAYTPLRKQAQEHQGKTYPGMVVVGEIVEWK